MKALRWITKLLQRNVSSQGAPSVTANKSVVGKHYGRNRKLWLEATLRKIPAGARILDAGAGELQYKLFCSHLQYVAQDFAQYSGEGDGVGYQTGTWDQSKLDIISDVISIPEPDASFDAIMCNEVFEHIPRPWLAIQEFERLLRPGGTLILTAPFCSLTHFSPHFYFTGFSPYFYKTLLQDAFEIQEITPNGSTFDYMAQILRRLPDLASRYSGIQLKSSELVAISKVLDTLQRCNEKENCSDELLCLGYFVRAIKK